MGGTIETAFSLILVIAIAVPLIALLIDTNKRLAKMKKDKKKRTGEDRTYLNYSPLEREKALRAQAEKKWK